MTGSVCSIAGFIWGVVWVAVSPVTQEIRQMREDLLRALGEIRDLLRPKRGRFFINYRL
jgi:hypothetical protein